MKYYIFLSLLICGIHSNAQLPFFKDKKIFTEIEKIELLKKNNLQSFLPPVALSNKLFSSESIPSQVAPIGPDTDFDGLTDAEEIKLGTSPTNPDTDGDGLIDSWEVGKVDNVDLKAMGASPLHKDIFVQMDYMEKTSATNGLAPNANVLFKIQQSFANSPVSNPDNVDGINIHLIAGDKVPFDDNLMLSQNDITEFTKIKKAHFQSNRAKFFHYMIWADSYNFSSSSGYSLGIPSSDFIVTLGKWNNGKGGTDDQKVGTFIHELGHNLGLMHGGSEHTNFKPNHLSVMNYLFQMSGVARILNNDKQFFYTYQPFLLPEIDESALIELNGIGQNPNLTGYFTAIYNPIGLAFEMRADGGIDWNRDLNIQTTPIQVDLNADTRLDKLRATPNEWAQLFFRGGEIGSFGPLLGIIDRSLSQFEALPFVELDEEMFKRISPVVQ